MKTRRITIIVFLLLPISLLAQILEVHLPSRANQEYSFCLMQGNKLDTVAKGKLDLEGKGLITLPVKYATYCGVGSLSFQDKSYNIIINGEQKITLSQTAISENPSFSGSAENSFLEDILFQQGQVKQKNGYVEAGLNLFQKHDLFYVVLEQEKMRLKNQYTSLAKKVEESHLYAARLMEMLECLSRIGDSLDATDDEIATQQKMFIGQKLDFKDLYTSGFWEPMLELWYQSFSSDDSLLVTSSKEMLEKTKDIIIRRELTQSIIQLFSKYGKDNLLMELGSEYLTIPINGKPAPELVTEGAPIQPKHSLIFFYDSDCGFCRNELHQLKEKYDLLSNDHNKMRVISVSGDTDKAMYEELAETFPWKDKLCDYKDFAGENFSNYGIVGSPTFILVDKEGIVRGRYARLSEFLKD